MPDKKEFLTQSGKDAFSSDKKLSMTFFAAGRSLVNAKLAVNFRFIYWNVLSIVELLCY